MVLSQTWLREAARHVILVAVSYGRNVRYFFQGTLEKSCLKNGDGVESVDVNMTLCTVNVRIRQE